MIVVAALEENIEEIGSCTDKDHIKRLQNEFQIMKAPLTSLLTSARKGVTELKTALKNQTGVKAAPDISHSIFETGPQHCEEVAVLNWNELAEANLDFSLPFIINMHEEETFKSLIADPNVKQFYDGFKDLFIKSDRVVRKSQDGRSQCPCNPAVHQKLQSFLKDVIKTGVAFGTEEAARREVLAEAVTSSAFGIVSGHDSGGVEKAWGACIRIAVEGSRKVIMTPMGPLASYMVALPEFKGQEIDCYTAATMRTYLASLSGDALQALREKGTRCS